MALQPSTPDPADLGQRIDGDDDLILTEPPAIEVTQQLPVDEELSFEVPTDQAPLNTASLFEQMERSVEAAEEARDEQLAGEESFQAANPGPPEGAGEDDIQQYMASLLQRNNGFSTAAPSEKPSTSDEPKQDNPENRRGTQEDRRKWDRRQKPRTIDANDLSNMRELANMNARSAIESHSYRQLVNLMRGHLIVSGVSVAISLTMLYLAADVHSVTYMVSVSALLAACTWTCKYLMRVRQLQGMQDGSEPAEPAGELAAGELAAGELAAGEPDASEPVQVATSS